MPDTLKPCPFCGGEANVSWNTHFGWVPWCDNGDCILNENTMGYETEQEAVDAWNRRVGCEPAGEYTASNRPQDGSWRVGEGEKG